MKVTPRLVYQEAKANGFNREEIYNLYDNQFTTGAGGTDLGERTVYLKLPEQFRDQTVAGRPHRQLRLRAGRTDVGQQQACAATSWSAAMHRH